MVKPNGLRLRLPNGPTLSAARRAGHPSVVIRLALAGGQVIEPIEHAGVAAVLSRALTQRSRSLTPENLASLLDEHGIVLTSGRDRHTTELVARCPAESLGHALGVLAELVLHPLFEDDSVRSTARHLQFLAAQQARSTSGAAVAAFRALAYPVDHPYARQPYGSVESLACVDAAAVDALYRLHVRPDRALLAIAGDMDLDRLADQVQRAFGEWSDDGATAPAPVPAAPSPRGGRHEVVIDDQGLTEVIVGGPANGRRAPDYRALQLATVILGQVGLSSRLAARLRERESLAYECYAALEDAPASGLWTARASVRAADVERAVVGVLEEVQRLQDEPVTADELASCRGLCRGSFIRQQETNAGLASLLQDMLEYGAQLDDLDGFPDVFDRVTAEDIQTASRTWLRVQDPLIVTARPRA